jgi:hypothetical protein
MGAQTKRPQVFVCYDLLERLIDEVEDLIFETNSELFLINIIIISKEIVSLLNTGMLEITINEEFKPQ